MNVHPPKNGIIVLIGIDPYPYMDKMEKMFFFLIIIWGEGAIYIYIYHSLSFYIHIFWSFPDYMPTMISHESQIDHLKSQLVPTVKPPSIPMNHQYVPSNHVRPPFYLSIYLSVCLSVYLSNYLYIYIYIYLSTHPLVNHNYFIGKPSIIIGYFL